ncbi:MAG: LLM class flavin-dependent oxidoreductase [Actinomycetota bacterium]
MDERRVGLTIPLEGVPLAESIVPMAQLAEEAGYTDIWSAEVGGTDGLTVLAAVAAATERLRLGTAILPVFSRPPALMAMSAASLQSLSGGRFVLGLGTSTSIIVGGWMGSEFRRPYTRMSETVGFLREALAGKKVNFEGQTFRSSGFRLTADPGSPVPIYVAALGPKMLALAGEQADGVILYLFTPEGAGEAVEEVRRAAERAGRDPDSIDVVARIPVALDEDEEAVRFFMRRLTASYAMVDVYNASLTRQGFGDEVAMITRLWRSGDREGAAEAVTDEMLEGLYVFGDLVECTRRLEEFRRAGVKTPVLFPASVVGDPQERLERVRSSVVALAGV